MRKSLMVFATLAGAAAFASVAAAGDAATETAEYGGCGFSQAYLQAQIDAGKANEKAEMRARLEALVDSALNAQETAAAPPVVPQQGPANGG